MSATDVERSQRAVLRTALANRRLIGFDGRLLAFVTIGSLLAGLTQAGLLLITARIASRVAGGLDGGSGQLGPFGAIDVTNNSLLGIGAALIGALVVLELAISWSQATLHANAQEKVRAHFLDVFGTSSYAAQSALARGDQQHILNSLTSGASTVTSHLGNGLVALMNFSTLAISAAILSPFTALTIIAGLVVMLGILRPILNMGRRASDDYTHSSRTLSAVVIEHLETALEVKAFGVSDHSTQMVQHQVAEVARSNQRVRFIGRMTSVVYRLGALALILAMLGIVSAVGTTNIAALTGALLMLLRSLSYGQATQSSYQLISENLPVLKQLQDEERRLLQAAPERSAAVTPKSFSTIELTGIGFTYPNAIEPAVQEIELRIQPGEFVAIVGPSGSGKSTLMDLLLRLREPSAGAITLGGCDLAEIESDWWHAHVGYVPQVSKLSSGTVTNAIRFGREWITDQAIREAAALAHIANDIESWPDGYDTEVEQLGDQLSGGQRQRIAVARALAGKPALLLLDEPTSSLDPVSERLIATSLEEIRGDTTVVTVAHRRKTIESASRVITFDAGRIVDGEPDIDLATPAEMSRP